MYSIKRTIIVDVDGEKFSIWQICFGAVGYMNNYHFCRKKKWNNQKINVNLGDIVIVVDENSTRNSWPIGIMRETIPDRNGLVRQVRIKIGKNIFIRPIDKL